GSGLLAPLTRLRLGPRFFERWGHFVVCRSKMCVGLGLLVLALLALPFVGLKIASVEANNIPLGSESRLGYQSLSENLGSGWMIPAIVLVQHPGADWMTN